MKKEDLQYLDIIKNRTKNEISDLLRDKDIGEITREALRDYFDSTKDSTAKRVATLVKTEKI